MPAGVARLHGTFNRDVGPLMLQSSTLSRILGLRAAEFAGACVDAVPDMPMALAKPGSLLDPPRGLAHILMRFGSDEVRTVHGTIKALLVALVATPFLYGLGAAAIEASGYRAGYGEGRVLLALSFLAACLAGQYFFRAPKNAHTKQELHEK